MRSRVAFAFAILLIFTEYGNAQQVKAVVSAGDFTTGIAPLGIASAFGTSLSTVTGAATALPLPTAISGNGLAWCDVTSDPSMVNCSGLQLFFVSPGQVNFAIPSVASSSTSHQFAVRPVLNGAGVGGAFTFPIQSFAPRVFWEGYDCLTDTRFSHPNVNCGLTNVKADPAYQSDRGAVTDQSGLLLTSAHWAKLGQAYTVWMTGLGLPHVSFVPYDLHLIVTNVPCYGFSGDTWIEASGNCLPG